MRIYMYVSMYVRNISLNLCQKLLFVTNFEFFLIKFYFM